MAKPDGFAPAGESGAVFSSDRRYRYALWRQWDAERGLVLFVGLNPSTAAESRNDPTIRRCMRFARDWGFGGVVVANLFAWRATHPEDLWRATLPVGTRNDAWLSHLHGLCHLTVACWGSARAAVARGQWFTASHQPLTCLRHNQSGAPAHPLYIPATQKPRDYGSAGNAQSRSPNSNCMTTASSRP